MIADEVEGQTLTYLLIRPLPRPMIYATKLAATWAVMAALAAVFTAVTYATVFRFDPALLRDVFPGRVLQTIALMLLALAAYGSLFGLASLFIRPMLFFGVAYIFIVEGLFANIEFVIRNLTILYQFRASLRSAGSTSTRRPWNIDLGRSPRAFRWAALHLAVASRSSPHGPCRLCSSFARREFRVKTPEST